MVGWTKQEEEEEKRKKRVDNFRRQKFTCRAENKNYEMEGHNELAQTMRFDRERLDLDHVVLFKCVIVGVQSLPNYASGM